MPLMSWSDKLSVGVQQLDDDHKKLVSMLNELHDGLLAGHGKESLGHVLDGLVAYTKTHFAHEEALFAKTHYPMAAWHKKEHDDLTKTVLDVQARFKGSANLTLTLDVMKFLKDWLFNHIQGSDKKYAPHLHTQGVH